MIMSKCGIEPAFSHSPRCERMSLALMTSGTSSVQPGYSRTKTLSSDGISDLVSYRSARIFRCIASDSGWARYWSSVLVRNAAELRCGDGAYSPKIVTDLPWACAFSQRKPPDEYASASSPSDG